MYCNVLTLKGERKIDRKTKSTQNKTHSREGSSSFLSLKGTQSKENKKIKEESRRESGGESEGERRSVDHF